MAMLNFSATGRYSANEAIDNFILGASLAKKYTHKFITNEATPCCDMENKVIYSPVLPAIINNEMDKIIRGKNEHEAGHGRFTPANKKPEWSKAKCDLINALEDERIESGVKAMSKAFENDIDYLNRFMIDKINTAWLSNGCQAKPIKEAIMALHIKSMGFPVMWKVSAMADKLINSADGIYAEIKSVTCTSATEFDKVESIADRILAVWEKVVNDDGNSGNDDTDDKQGGDDSNSGDNNTDSTDNSGADNTDNADSNSGNGADGDGDNADGEDSTDNSGDGDDTDNSGNGADGDNADGNNTDNADSADGADGSNDVDLDNLCDGEDMDTILEKELQKMIKEAQADFGEYTAYTAEDEIIKAEKKPDNFNKAYSTIAGAISMLASHLEQSLRTQSRCRNIGNRDKGYLDRNALPMLAKNLTKNVFYTKRQGISLDTTVSILIDESGSMWGAHEYCRSMAIAIAEVLERLNVKFEILGHTTGQTYQLAYEDKQHFNRVTKMMLFEHKNFNESYRNEKYRLGSIHHYNCNIDGEALLATFKRAIEQKSNRHIILVLSDGEPSGAKSGGERHLTNAVQYCRKNGCEVYAFGIGTDEPEKYYGKDSFIYLPSINDLNGQFFRKLSNIIINGRMN